MALVGDGRGQGECGVGEGEGPVGALVHEVLQHVEVPGAHDHQRLGPAPAHADALQGGGGGLHGGAAEEAGPAVLAGGGRLQLVRVQEAPQQGVLPGDGGGPAAVDGRGQCQGDRRECSCICS